MKFKRLKRRQERLREGKPLLQEILRQASGQVLFRIKKKLVLQLHLLVSSLATNKLLIFGVDRTAARGFFSAQHGVDDGSGAAHARADMEGIRRTVSCTGAAFHAGIPVRNFYLAIAETQDSMGADQKARPAPHAFFLIKT